MYTHWMQTVQNKARTTLEQTLEVIKRPVSDTTTRCQMWQLDNVKRKKNQNQAPNKIVEPAPLWTIESPGKKRE